MVNAKIKDATNQHCFVLPSPLTALTIVNPQLRTNTTTPNAVQATAGNLARVYQ